MARDVFGPSSDIFGPDSGSPSSGTTPAVYYGVKADGRTVTDAAISSVTNPTQLSSNQAQFTSAHVNMRVVVIGAGATAGTHLYTTIQSVSNGVATLANAAGTTVSGAECWFGTDNTTACQNAINAAALTNGTVEFPEGDIGISAPLTTPAGPVSIRGQDVKELYGFVNANSYQQLMQPPYLSGTVFVQSSPNVDILQLGAQGVSQNVRRIGLRFAGRYSNTGYGLNATPSTNRPGIMGSVVEDVRVFGQDGNHYGFLFTAPCLSRFTGLRAYGGGGIRLYNGATADDPGNNTFVDYYSCTFLNGSAHGLFLDGSGTGGNFQYCVFQRCQTWVIAPNPVIPGTSPPTSAQYNLQHSNGGAMLAIGFQAVDFETNVNSKSNFPWGNQCYRNSWPSTASVANAAMTNFPANGSGQQNQRGCRVRGKYSISLTPLTAAQASSTLSAGAGYGATSITVAAATGFAAGQCIQIDTGANIEYAIILSVVGTTINLDTTKMGGWGLVLTHASGAAVKAGAAVAYVQTNTTNGWPGGRKAQVGAPINATADLSSSTQTVDVDIPAAYWVRSDLVNAAIVWNAWDDAILT